MAVLFDPVNKQPGSHVKMNESHQITELIQSTTVLNDAFPNLPALRATLQFLDKNLSAERISSPTVFAILRHWLAKGGEIQGVPITSTNWADIDTPHDLLRQNYYLLTDGWSPQLNPSGTYLPQGQSLEGPLENATLALGRHSQIQGPVLLGTQVQVGENCLIHDGTTLGDNTIVAANSELAQCITLPQSQVPSNVDLRAAVLDAHGTIVH
jgi:NDP-sugar pyrophosphorylase family protein